MEIEDLRELVMAWAGTIYTERVVGKKESAQLDKEEAALLAALDDAEKYRQYQKLGGGSIHRVMVEQEIEAQRYREALQAHHAITYSTGLVEVGEVCPVCGIPESSG